MKTYAMFVLLAATLGGCSAVQLPQAERAEAIHDCAVGVLRPYLGSVAENVLAAVLAGGSLKAALGVHGIGDEDGMKIVEGLNACIAGGSPEAVTVTATPVDASL